MIKFIGFKNGGYEAQDEKSGEVFRLDNLSAFDNFLLEHQKNIDYKFCVDCIFAGVDYSALLGLKACVEKMKDAELLKLVEALSSDGRFTQVGGKVLMMRPKLLASVLVGNKFGLRDGLSPQDIYALPCSEADKINILKKYDTLLLLDKMPIEDNNKEILQKVLKSKTIENNFELRNRLSPKDVLWLPITTGQKIDILKNYPIAQLLIKGEIKEADGNILFNVLNSKITKEGQQTDALLLKDICETQLVNNQKIKLLKHCDTASLLIACARSNGDIKILTKVLKSKTIKYSEELAKNLFPREICRLPITIAQKIDILKSYSHISLMRDGPYLDEDKEIVYEALKSRVADISKEEFFKYCDKLHKKLIIEYYKKNKNQFTHFEDCMLMNKFPYLEKYMDRKIEDVNKTKALLERISVFNLDLTGYNKIYQGILEPNVIDNIGEENVYNLIKYAAKGAPIDLSGVIDDPVSFKKYYEFRLKNLPQDNLQPNNVIKAANEFSKNYDLIKDCMQQKLSEQEEAILAVAITESDKIMLFEKDDLNYFTSERTEYLKRGSSSDTINYILTKNKKLSPFEERLLSDKDQLETILNDFPELAKQVETMNIISSFREMMISYGTSESERRKFADILIADLENEFTPKGSMVASLRNYYSTFADDVRAKYGEELKNSLSNSFEKLPKAEKTDGVDLIRLDKSEKKFKLLIHGLNAYGKGGSEVWGHSETGKSYLCTSLISDTHLGRAPAKIYYGFNNISSEALILEGDTDISSHEGIGSFDASAGRANFAKSDDLLEETKINNYHNYNEIVLRREQFDENGKAKPITPNYIVAFDEISDLDKQEAKRLNIPIVFIDTKVYGKLHNEEKTSEKSKERTDKKTLKKFSSMHAVVEEIFKTANEVDAREQKEVIKEINEAIAHETTKNDEVGHSQ